MQPPNVAIHHCALQLHIPEGQIQIRTSAKMSYGPMAAGLALVQSLKTLASWHRKFWSRCSPDRLITKPVQGILQARNASLKSSACSDPLHLPPAFSELSKIHYWLPFPIHTWARLQHFSILFILPYWSKARLAEAWAAIKREWQKRQCIKGEGSYCSTTEPPKHLRASLGMCQLLSHAWIVKSTAGIKSLYIPCVWAWSREDLARTAPCWFKVLSRLQCELPQLTDNTCITDRAAHQREHLPWGAYSLSKHDREQQGEEKQYYSQSYPEG